MLINTSPRRPNRERAFDISKTALHTALSLPDGAMVTVTELACLEEGCPPVETVVALLRPDAPPLQFTSFTNPRTPSTPKTWSRSARHGGSTSQDPILVPRLKES